MAADQDPVDNTEQIPAETEIEKGLKEKELQNLVLKKILEAMDHGQADRAAATDNSPVKKRNI